MNLTRASEALKYCPDYRWSSACIHYLKLACGRKLSLNEWVGLVTLRWNSLRLGYEVLC